MDSSGIGLLMGRYRALGMRGKCVQVVNVNSHIQKLLRLSEWENILKSVELKIGR